MAGASIDFSQWNHARNVCVVGAGTMGSGIAAHLANLGFRVTLLDISREAAEAAVARTKSSRPPQFYLPDTAANIRTGSIDDDLDFVRDADWLCEAVVEKLDVKRDLFARIEPVLNASAMVSTNTSGLEISLLAEGRSESFRKRFLGTHFFNPPRYLKLLELIPTGDTDPAAVSAYTKFLEERVARRVVLAKDTPGFIANRYGMWSMFHAIHCAEKLHLSIEQVDAITGPFLGRPRSGSFRLNDLVGLDIMQDIASNLLARCPDDPHTGSLRTPPSMAALMERGWIGDKAGCGYYKKEGKDLLAVDLGTLAYRQKQEPELDSLQKLGKLPLGERVSQALDLRDEVGEFLRQYLVPTLRYADYLKEEISHSVRDFDRVMMWGFGWELGPFGLIDAIGADKLGIATKRFYEGGMVLDFKGSYAPTTPEPEYSTIQDFQVVSSGESHNLRDLGDGVLAFCLTTKMGSISPTAVKELTSVLESGRARRLVFTSESKVFSVGFDLNFFAAAIEQGNTTKIEAELRNLQRAGALLEQIPSVAAVWGFALGAGLELALSCSVIAANAETQIGLPESRVGLLPGGRGTVLLRLLNQASAKGLAETAMLLTDGTIAAGADHAKALGYLRRTDATIYHPDRLITDAKRLALTATPFPLPNWARTEGPLGGMIDQLQSQAKAKGGMSDYDELIGDRIKSVFSKSESYDDALHREREAFIDLCSRPLTLARIKHMLDTGKPLRN